MRGARRPNPRVHLHLVFVSLSMSVLKEERDTAYLTIYLERVTMNSSLMKHRSDKIQGVIKEIQSKMQYILSE